ncbi:flagellar hook-associated protein FlgK [Gluconobacter morbifer]|uniref:Flagellar hook-associated protein 1 n=1 Tax=Gluconobacter morbifer G707 TaxID=1088869 RepID=G6XK84_9PROT|nr:flagellar hook-associated protein FlgK [Gluconobacter morbifer]EHH67680.1 flagellar hook-associated protein 1 FlgK [Gluconobacter morbifer G707]
MGLNSALSIAASGLNAVQNAMNVASNNVSNSGTAGYIREVANVQSTVAGNTGSGVRVAATTLATSEQLQKALYSQNADVASYSTTQTALSAITALQGSTSASSGSSGTLPDLLGNLQSSLTALTAIPTSASAQNTVLSDASSFCDSVHTLADTYQQQRQTAQDGIVSSISDINTDLTTIGTLSTRIMTLKSQDADTASLENQRFTALSSLSSELSVNWSVTSSGDMSISTADGMTLPTRDTSSASGPTISSDWPLSTSGMQISASSVYPGNGDANSISGITLNGKDITSHLTGGTLGANITLRDTTLPTMQAQLDAFSSTVASRFQAQGMSLFTISSDQVPGTSQTTLSPDGSIGLSQDITVSSTYTNDPSLLVDGNSADTDTVQNVLKYSFGTTLADGTSQPASPTSGLGMSGTLVTGYSGNQGLVSLATTLTANQAATASNASTDLSYAQTSQSSLSSGLSETSSVSVDTEMANIVTLQNAYSANAKVISTVQTMFSAFLNAIGT